MGEMTVRHVSGDQFTVNVRGHTLLVDQSVSDGGADAGPTPVELFAAALSSGVAQQARTFLSRHGIDLNGLQVSASFDLSGDEPARIARLDLRVQPPSALPPERREALLAVASRWTVQSTLLAVPEVSIALDVPKEASAA